ncbi:hypothetical protein COU37_02180 [Candidatus Micrarchaeota archaeon CG10_big_fil_rev_8_21_14_0_10_45_29]|nr:MAG: hypothetical protein COU37_02180 [Candidatus Micrarchaeota archaeon CG10_big_fil_rev_8_21_14_0_10_45_29]
MKTHPAIQAYEKHFFSLLLLASLLSIIPIWIIPIAPLSDWSAHLAISSQINYLMQGGSSQFFYIDYSFLGYSFVHLLISSLTYFFPLEISGKITLSLLYILSPICWYKFFSSTDPSKKYLATFGFLMSYSSFFYYGNINFLFSLGFSLLFLSYGLKIFEKQKQNLSLFILFGFLAYLSHFYVFLLASFIIAFLAIYKKFWLGEKIYLGLGGAIFVQMAVLAFLDVLTNNYIPRDSSYSDSLYVCSIEKYTQFSGSTFNVSGFFPKLIGSLLTTAAHYNPLGMFNTVFPFPNIILALIFLGLPASLFILLKHFKEGKPVRFYWQRAESFLKSNFHPAYLPLITLLAIHFLLIPNCLTFICHIGDRALPFMYAFIFLSIKKDSKLILPLSILFLILFALNLPYQAFIFSDSGALQAGIIEKTAQYAKELPENSTLFVIPSNYTSVYSGKSSAPLPNPYYQSLALYYNPKIYIAGIFGFQDTFIMRSREPLFDDMAHFGPIPGQDIGNVSECYEKIPKEFNYYISQNMSLVKNS